ncbi:MAG: AMP-binding protein [Thermoleophilia bacterium]
MSDWTDWYLREDPTTWVLPRLLAERAERHPDRPYARFADGDWRTYGQTHQQATRIANGLIRRDVDHGASVSVMLPNCEEFIPVWFGILTAGAVMSPINTAYRGEFLTWCINLVEARLLIISDRFLDRLEEVRDQLPLLQRVVVVPHDGTAVTPDRTWARESLEALMDAPDTPPPVAHAWTDDARIMFTSGTTGRSKGVIKQHAADYFSARSALASAMVRRGVELDGLADEVYFTCLPQFHSNPQVLCAYPALLAGARVAVAERFSGTRFWQQAIDAEATTFNGIGAMLYFLWNQPPSELDRAHRVHTVSAAPAPTDIYHEFEERFGVRLAEGYGLTETGVATLMDPTRPTRLGSCGVANPGYEVTIVEPGTDLPLPPDTPGEIVVDQKIPNIIMRAYYGMPEKTAEDFRNLKLHTGDLGRMDADGYVYFMDRLKDYIRRRGENISSMELERQVEAHPAIRRAVALGVPAGEGVGAEDEILLVCIPEGEAPDHGAFVEWMSERLPHFMLPRYIRFVAEFPMTPTERVKKTTLREQGITPDTYDRGTGR